MLVHTHQADSPMLQLQNNETLCIEQSMCVSAHAKNRYSNAPASVTLKTSARKRTWVLVHTNQTDIPMLHLQQH